MTITPMPVLPAASRGSASRAADGKPGKAADDFATVLDGHLNGAKTAAGKATDPKRHPAPKDAAPSEVASADAQSGAAPLGVAQPGAVQPGPVPTNGLPAVPVEAPGVVAVAATTATDVAAPTGSPLVAGADAETSTATPTGTAADPATPHQPAALDVDVPAQPKVQPESATAEAAVPHQPTTSAEPLPAVAAELTVTKAPGVKAPATAVAAEQPEPTTAVPTAGVAAPATSAADAPAAGPAQPTAPSPVLAQVTPALARVVTRGDGEHRMMLKLHPADLGEIHLTVTVRGEHVDVEIAAGAQARDVLRDGSAHLRSLLESIGRSTGQLVLRDLPSTPAAPTHGAGLDTGQQQDGRGTSYDGTDGSRRDRSGTGAERQRPSAEPDRPVPTRPASLRTNVPGASALDVTV